MKFTFEEWKRLVDVKVADILGGLTTDDLPDMDYYQMYLDKISPTNAAKKAISNAKNH